MKILICGAEEWLGAYLRREVPEAEIYNEVSAELLHHLAHRPERPDALVFISTWEVYSPDAGEEIDEGTPAAPATPFGQTCLCMERECLLWGEAAGVPVAILRTGVIFGTGMTGWPNEMFADVIHGRYLHVRGMQGRISTVAALDVARAAKAIAGRDGIYNVADGVGPTWLALAEAMSANAGARKRMITLPEKWAEAAWKYGRQIPAVKASLAPDVLERRSAVCSISPQKIIEATGLKFFNTLEVLSREASDYPYDEI